MSNLTAVIVGWLFAVPAFCAAFSGADSDTFAALRFAAHYCALFFFVFWLLVLIPLHLVTPFRSRVWHPVVFVPGCALSVVLFYSGVMVLVLGLRPEDLFRGPHLAMAAAVGAIVAVVDLVLRSPTPRHAVRHSYDY